MTNLLEKIKGDNMPLPPRPAIGNVLLAAIGGFIAITIIALTASQTGSILLLGSFGASCVLVFGFPDIPFAQPRNVIGGHFLSTLVGLACISAMDPHWWSLAIAVAAVMALMMVTRTTHPPAGSNPVIVFLALPGWKFLFFPTLLGACLLIVVALVYNNAFRDHRYPKYW